ncbi:FecR domain-containing protein [Flammeovirgaceae bacterium SG7u.111]|nr:FecR domain-containing protein [Flammeovirgaceae bacterium SG7u.132]WPO37685.1 FecR domain-containing protein [Flammeovirgaceae bacterium SG7u.111]
MHNYNNYSSKDFIQDEQFKRWVLNPTSQLDAKWAAIIEKYPYQLEAINIAKNTILSLNFQQVKAPSNVKERIWEEVMASQHETNIIANERKENKKAKKSILRPLGVAASFLLLVTFWFTHSSITNETDRQKEIHWITKRTLYGEKLSLKLKDGTLVKLNSESSLRFPQEFADTREVYLEGEAFFEVKRNTSTPFIIHTGEVDTKVLGTSFNVDFDTKENNVNVSVLEGKVSVSKKENELSVILTPNQMAVSDSSNTLRKISYVDINEIIAWKDGVLLFNEASFSEVIVSLEKWYGVKFINEKKLTSSARFTGRFENNESLEIVLMGLEMHYPKLGFKINGKNILLTKK